MHCKKKMNRGLMKNFREFRGELMESELVEEGLAGGMPPNILILRRQSIRQFPDQTLIALYYNDKLDQHFSIPFGPMGSSVITPTSLKEETEETPPTQHHTKNKFHNTLTKHGFVHHSTEFSSRITPVTTHRYTHPDHGKSHVDVSHYHRSGDTRWIHRWEQPNGLMSPGAGETKPALSRTLDRHHGPEEKRAWYAKTHKPSPKQESVESLDEFLTEMNREIISEINMGKKDHEVVKAFLEKRPHDSKKLSTDGKRLDGNWLGGRGIAHHGNEKNVHMNDLGSKSAQQVHRTIKKHSDPTRHKIVNEDTEVSEPENLQEGLTGPTRMQLQNHFDSSHGTDREKLNSVEKTHGVSDVRMNSKKQIISWKTNKQAEHTKKHGDIGSYLEEDAIAHLRSVKEFHTNKALKHQDGTQTKIDPTTANALLTVHDALHPNNQKKFADHLTKSKTHFHKMLDFAWKNVK